MLRLKGDIVLFGKIEGAVYQLFIFVIALAALCFIQLKLAVGAAVNGSLVIQQPVFVKKADGIGMPVGLFVKAGDAQAMHDVDVLIAFLPERFVEPGLPQELVQAVAGIVVAHQEDLFYIMGHGGEPACSGRIGFSRRLGRASHAVFHDTVLVEADDAQLIEFFQGQEGKGHLDGAGGIVVVQLVQPVAVGGEVRRVIGVPVNFRVEYLHVIDLGLVQHGAEQAVVAEQEFLQWVSLRHGRC